MSTTARVIADALQERRGTILRNVRLEVDAVQRETHARLQGRYNPATDAKRP